MPTQMPSADLPAASDPRGPLVSVEGLNGVGKTYLSQRVRDRCSRPVVALDEFSARSHDAEHDLGRRLLRALAGAAAGDPFLRGGSPRCETLTLLAIKLHDFESALPELNAGHTVMEGRSLHSVAVYQSLILEPHDDTAAAALAGRILTDASQWRPLPDRTFVVTDDTTRAIERAQHRDNTRYSPEQWTIHRRAAHLLEYLAAQDPGHVQVLDRRELDEHDLVERIHTGITHAPRRPWTDPDRRYDPSGPSAPPWAQQPTHAPAASTVTTTSGATVSVAEAP